MNSPQTPLTPESCPCGSGLSFATCCQPYLHRTSLPADAEALMRSRYCAHVVADIDYLIATWAPEYRTQLDPIALRQWATDSTWLSLQVLRHKPAGDQAQVEFIARYRDNTGKTCIHHELSQFRCEAGQWLFVTGETPKVPGRNSSCPCGSGKKYKRCCGNGN